MAENLQDEILVFEDCKKYDISYPVIVTRWEIKQVHGLNKQYLQVYFQKLDNTVKAFQMNIACYSAFGKEVEKRSDISIQEVDKKDIDFSEVIPLNTDTRKVEIFMCQCLLVDGTMIEKNERQIVADTFKPFTEEDKEAGKRLLPSAAGYPIDNVSHWFCACGTIYSAESESCERCNKSKEEIFSLIVPEKLQREKAHKAVEEKEEKKENILSGAYIFLLGFIAFIASFFPVLQVNDFNISVYWFNISDFDLSSNWNLFTLLGVLQLLCSLGIMVLGVLVIFRLFNKNIKKITVGISIGSMVLMILYLWFSCGIWNDNKYYRLEYNDFSSYLYQNETCYNVTSFSWLGILFESVLIIGYIIFAFLFSSEAKKNQNEDIISKKQRFIINGFTCLLSFLMFISLSIPIMTRKGDIQLNGFRCVGLDNCGFVEWLLWIDLCLHLVASVALIVMNVLCIIKSNKYVLRIANITAVVCTVFVTIYGILGILICSVDPYYHNTPLSYISIIVNIPFIIGYYICRKKLLRDFDFGK